jgi:metallophosphoesterase (TIGR00282 family)
MFQKHIGRLRKELAIDAVVVNGENSDNRGRGITPRIVNFFKHNGADVVTTGNHIWANKEIYPYLASNNDLLRPANFPSDTPGVGVTTFNCQGHTIAVINIIGRVFMKDHVACPFRTAESLLTYLRDKTKTIFVDIHAETTAEKIALGFFLDGKVSGIVGTHTHVQTADERVLPNGTAFITDLGMTGALNSMLGMKKEAILHNFLTQMPVRFEVEESSPVIMTGAWIEVDPYSGKALKIERVRISDEHIQFDTAV